MNKDDTITVVVEIPLNSRIKYEVKGEILVMDRVLNIPMPCNYGYIPKTLWADGDALDICIVGDLDLVPLTVLDVVPKFIIKVIDGGVSDYKVVAGLTADVDVRSWLPTLIHYFNTYKPGVICKGLIEDPEEVGMIIDGAKLDYITG